MSRTELFSRKVPGGIFGVTDESKTTGEIFWVDSATGTDAAGWGKSPDTPTATIDYAVGLATASKGDRIYVLPHHAEAITAATSLVIDKAGLQIIGLGYGAARPLLTFTTAATATISITAASCLLKNIQMKSAFTNGITVGITVGASADGLRLEDIRMEESLNTQEFLIAISVAAACHDVGIDGFDFFGVAGGTDSQCIKFVGASNFSFVRNFRIFGDFSGAPIDALTAASTFMHFERGVICNVDTGAGLTLSVKSDTTGFVNDIRALGALDTATPAGAAMGWSEVYVTNDDGTQGILKPAADS